METKECPDCKGSGKKPLKYLGEKTDPCPSCAGTGIIEVPEETLTAWQQEVVTLLRRIAVCAERFAACVTDDNCVEIEEIYDTADAPA